MDFDHVKGNKVSGIAIMVGYKTISMEELLAEMEKCELVCANCHRIRTKKRAEVRLALKELYVFGKKISNELKNGYN